MYSRQDLQLTYEDQNQQQKKRLERKSLKKNFNYYSFEKLLRDTSSFTKLKTYQNSKANEKENNVEKNKGEIETKMNISKRNLELYLTKQHQKMNSSFSLFLKNEMVYNDNMQKRKKITKLKKLLEDTKQPTPMPPKKHRQDYNFNDTCFKLRPLSNACYDSIFPSHRYRPALVSNDKTMFLIGGYHMSKYESLNLFHRYDFDAGKWSQMKISGEVPKINPCYHTAQIYKNYLIVIGGVNIESDQKNKRFSNEVLLYNMQKGQWQKCRTNLNLKHHSTTIFHNNIMIQGGINDKEKYNEDLMFLNLSQSNISNPIFLAMKNRCDNPKFQTIANHRIAHTYQCDNGVRNQFQYDGVFSFGGNNAQGQLSNNLFFINCMNKVNQTLQLKFKKWETVPTNQDKPCPRKNHSMSIVNRKGVLIVIGGMDELQRKLNDIWLFDLIRLKWTRVNTEPIIEDSLGLAFNHSTCTLGNTIYIYNSDFQSDKKNQLLWALDTDTNPLKTKKALYPTKLASTKLIFSEKQQQSMWNIS